MMDRIVNNVCVYGLDQSVVASGYSMRTKAEMHEPEGKDYNRAEKLGNVPVGSGHDQFLTGIIAQFDLTFSNKAWIDIQRYHFFDYVSSQSTIHCITKFDLSKSYNEYVDPRMIDIMREYVDAYNAETDPERKKVLYLQILYNNPAGFLLTARMTTNYRQLKTIWIQRHNHILPDFRKFCSEIELFPFFTTFCLGEYKSDDE